MKGLVSVSFLVALVASNNHTTVASTISVLSSATTLSFIDDDSIGQTGENMCYKIPNEIVRCSSHQRLSILTCNCISYSSSSFIEVGKCNYNTLPDLTPYKDLPKSEKGFTEVMCGEFNREGTLCGNCRAGYYPLAYSFDMTCVECPNGRTNWWKFVLAAFLPLTVFYFIVLLFKINITSSHLNGLFLYSQALILPEIARVLYLSNSIRHHHKLKQTFQFVGMLYGIWNLDFLRSLDLGICLEADTLQILALDAVIGIYPLFLMIVSYFLIKLYDQNLKPFVILWKPFHAVFSIFRQKWDIRTSLVDAFMTFFVISYMKFLSVSYDLLAPVELYTLDSSGNLTVSWRLYYNASVPYFGEKHLPYGILGAAVLLFFVLLPTLLLIVYPFRWFQKLLNLFPFRWYILHTFMDSLEGSYKDGTQPGTRDYRWFASTFFMIRLILMLIGISTINLMFYPLSSIVFVVYIIIFVNLNPFKNENKTVTNSIFLLLLAITYTFPSFGVKSKVVYLLGAITFPIPFLYMSALTLQWIYNHRKFGLQFLNTFKGKWYGYNRLQ